MQRAGDVPFPTKSVTLTHETSPPGANKFQESPNRHK
jgi:hypothetical protein